MVCVKHRRKWQKCQTLCCTYSITLEALFYSKERPPARPSLAFPEDPSPCLVTPKKSRKLFCPQPYACRLTPANTLSRTMPGYAHWSPGWVISLHTHSCIGANPNNSWGKHTYERYLTQSHCFDGANTGNVYGSTLSDAAFTYEQSFGKTTKTDNLSQCDTPKHTGANFFLYIYQH